MPDKTLGRANFLLGFCSMDDSLAGIFFWLWFKLTDRIPQEKLEAWTEEYFGKFGGPILLWSFYISFVRWFPSSLLSLHTATGLEPIYFNDRRIWNFLLDSLYRICSFSTVAKQ